MKQKITLLLAVCALIAPSAFSQKHLGKFKLEQTPTQAADAGKSKQMSIQEALEWRYKLLADENGNFFPSYYTNANQQANVLRQQGSQRSATLQWEELGPTNIGGRTRSILFDKRDPSRATIYAGAVGGGLWKSTDHGENWTHLPSVQSCQAVTCIAQAPNNTIYFGTGEGLAQPAGNAGMRNSGTVGNGLHMLYGNDLDSLLPSTYPGNISNSSTWSMVNRIAINPTDSNDIFAATSGSSSSGLMHSLDGGVTWNQIGSSGFPISGLSSGYFGAADVKFSADGTNVFASVGPGSQGPGSRFIYSTDGGYSFTNVPYSSFPNFANAITRIEIAVAPSNSNVVYISVATSNGDFGGAYKSSDAGANWTLIGSKGSSLNPFGTNNQGWYDNVLAVNPFDEDKVYIGGTQMFTYTSLSGWSLTTLYQGDASMPNWVHPDMHAIIFNDLDRNEMFVGCDGGLFRSNNAYSAFPIPTFTTKNRGYGVTQNYSVAADFYGNVLGGAQDNGTNYVNYQNGGLTYAKNVYGGDGVFTEISHFDPNIFVGGYVSGNDYRSNTLGNTWVDLFDGAIDPQGFAEPSRCGQQKQQGNAPFVTAFWLQETKKATNTVSKVNFTDTISHYAGEVITLMSHTKQTFQETLTDSIHKGTMVSFTDRLQSRLYFATSCGLWMTPDILDFSNGPRWFRLTASSDDVKSLTSTVTGDTIYITGNSRVTRISGLNSILFDTFSTGQNGIVTSGSPLYQEVPSIVVGSGHYIEGIDVDKNDPNHVLCTVAGYSSGTTSHVYHSTDAGHTWSAVGDALPNMPVYDCVIDAYDANHYIIGSELGVWDSYDRGGTWNEQNAGVNARLPVYRLRQQSYLDDNCYALYIGTHGRGMWRSTTITAAQGRCDIYALGVNEPKNQNLINNMMVYPNPMGNTTGKVMIELAKASDITLRVIDMPGRVLQETAFPNLKEGKNELSLNTSNLANGTYLVVGTLANGQSYTRTLVVAK